MLLQPAEPSEYAVRFRNEIRLTYHENAKLLTTTVAKGWWTDADSNTDTSDRIRHRTVKAKETCAYFKFIVSDSEGYYLLASGKAFDISRPILWLTITLTAGYSTTKVYLAYASISVHNHVSGFTGTLGALLYIAGMLVGSTILPTENI